MNVIPGLHFDRIYQEAIKPLGLAIEADHDNVTDEVRLTRRIQPTEKHSALNRMVWISQVDSLNRFHVRMIESVCEPYYATADEKFTALADFSDELTCDIRFAYRLIRDFFKREVEVKKIPPAEVIAKAEDINKNYMDREDCKVEIYLCSGEYGDDWKYRVRGIKEDKILCEHIFPDNAHGHTLYLMVCAIRQARKEGVVEGMHIAAERLMKRIANDVFNTSGVPMRGLHPAFQDLLNRSNIRGLPGAPYYNVNK